MSTTKVENNDIEFLRPSTKASFKSAYCYQSFSKRKLEYIDINNGFILPNKDNSSQYGGVVSEDGEFVDISGLHEGKGRKYDFDGDIESTFSVPVIYIGFILPIWGHVITDGIKKIWFLTTEEGKKWIKMGAQVAYVTLSNAPLPQYVIDLFLYAGVSMDRCIHVKTIAKCRRVIVPQNSLFIEQGKRYYTHEYKETIAHIKNSVNSMSFPSFSKIYLTRTHLNRKNDYGEKNIEKKFKKMGYTIIAPEEYSVAHQIFLMSHCCELASTEGSISHNAIFCKEHTHIVIIKKANYWNGYQKVINDVEKLIVTWVDAHHSLMANKKEPWRGPFYLCNSSEFAKYIGKKNIFPYWMMPTWYKYLIENCLYKLRVRLALHNRSLFPSIKSF